VRLKNLKKNLKKKEAKTLPDFSPPAMPRRKNRTVHHSSTTGWSHIPGHNTPTLRLPTASTTTPPPLPPAQQQPLPTLLLSAQTHLHSYLPLTPLLTALTHPQIHLRAKHLHVLGLGSLSPSSATRESSILQLALVLEVAAALGGQLDLVFKDPAFTIADQEFLSRYGRVEEVRREEEEERVDDVLDGFAALSLCSRKKKKRRRQRRWGEDIGGVTDPNPSPSPEDKGKTPTSNPNPNPNPNPSPEDKKTPPDSPPADTPDSPPVADMILLAPHLDFDVLASHLSSHPPPLLLLCNDLADFLEL